MSASKGFSEELTTSHWSALCVLGGFFLLIVLWDMKREGPGHDFVQLLNQIGPGEGDMPIAVFEPFEFKVGRGEGRVAFSFFIMDFRIHPGNRKSKQTCGTIRNP